MNKKMDIGKSKIIQVDGLNYKPNGKMVLSEISFYVKEGDFVSILGPNGAGKTTLLRHLVKVIEPDPGKIFIGNKHIEKYSNRKLARIISYVPQAKGYIPPYMVEEFLVMSRYAYLGPFARISEKDFALISTILRKLNMSEFLYRYLDTLSGGERQKIYIASAIIQKTPIIVLDEPTTFLDPNHNLEIYNLINNLNQEEGKTIIMSTHDVNSALKYSDRILCMKEGKVIFYGDPNSLIEGDILNRLYGVQFIEYSRDKNTIGDSIFIPGGDI